MPVYLDDQPLNLQAARVGEILDAAARRLGERGRIIAQVELAGDVLDDQQLAACRSAELGGRELRLLSADPRELVLESVPEVCAELQALGPVQGQVAQLLQQDKRRAALGKLPEILGVWQRAQQLLGYALTLLGDAAEGLEVDGRSPGQFVEALAKQLREARQLIEAADTVALADALAYEWPKTAEHWVELLHTVARELKSR